jgi:hypothetical protein
MAQRGRPKLKPGEKGKYQQSSVQKKRVEARRKLKRQKQEVERAQKSLEKLTAKKESIKTADKVSKQGGVIDNDIINNLPASVRQNLEDDTELVFRPNEGPQTDFLAAPEKEVLYGGAAGGGKSYAMLVDLLR